MLERRTALDSLSPAVGAAMGAHLLDHALAVLDHATRAAWLPREAPRLAQEITEANHRVQMLRLLLRGARDRRHLSEDQHAHAVEQLDTIGRQLGAWRASLSSRSS